MGKVQGTGTLAAVLIITLAGGVSSDSWAWPNSKREVSSVVSIGTKINFEDSAEDDIPDRNRTSKLQEPQSDQSDDMSPIYDRGTLPVSLNGPNQYTPPGDNAAYYNRVAAALNYAVLPERIREEKIYRVNAQEFTRFNRSVVVYEGFPLSRFVDMVQLFTSRDKSWDLSRMMMECRIGTPSDSNGNYPIYNVDNCKCVRPYNCPSPAVVYGSCAPEKSFCCFGSPKSNAYQNPDVLLGPGYTGQNQFSTAGQPSSVFVNTQDNYVDSNRGVLVGPSGPTGIVGPGGNRPNKGLLVGPEGPTGIIGPAYNRNSGFLPTLGNILRPNSNNGILVGPGGPTGHIGPANNGVLVGPGGPTGIIGPASPGILVGPGGPTGVIGPGNGGFLGHNRRPSNFIRNQGQGLLVGPGGPTGIIGPGYGRRY